MCAFGYIWGTIAYFSIGGLEGKKKGRERIKWKNIGCEPLLSFFCWEQYKLRIE